LAISSSLGSGRARAVKSISSRVAPVSLVARVMGDNQNSRAH
jgi:hypothetical protein